MQVYDHPELYAAAYSFRDIEREVAFALDQAERALGRPATSAAELAAGPALHGRLMAARGLRVAAVEISPAAADWLRAAAPALEVVTADLRDFTLAEPVELMICPLSGFSYLLDDGAWLAALECVARSLVEDGVLVLELAPDDARRQAVDAWTVDTVDGPLDVSAGPSVMVDEEVFEWLLTLRLGELVLTTVERQRRLAARDAERLLARSGRFGSVRCHAGYERAQRYRGHGSLVISARRRP